MAKKFEPSPCSMEGEIWRACLKKFDYTPERGRESACDDKRAAFYACINATRDVPPAPPAGVVHRGTPSVENKFTGHPECGLISEKFQACMAEHAYDLSCCPQQMLVLRRCAAKYDPVARMALDEDIKAGRVPADESDIELGEKLKPKSGTFWGYLTGK